MLVVIHGKDGHPNVGLVTKDFRRGFDAIEAGQTDVHQDNVGSQLAGERDGISPVIRFTDDLKVLVKFQDRADPVSHNLMIIDQQYTCDHYNFCLFPIPYNYRHKRTLRR